MTDPLPPLPSPLAGAIGRSFWNEGRAPIEVARVGRNANTSSVGVSRVIDALDSADEPAVLIGHSRRGQQSRVAAYRRPDQVSQLITLGSPVRAHLPRQAALRASVETIRLLRFLPFGPSEDSAVEAAYEQDLLAPFDVDVPWATIWSRIDGVIEWQACLDDSAASREINCSHSGMIASVASFRAITAVLSEPLIESAP